MSAFARGFQMGGEMYDSAERMKLAKEQQQWAREEAEAKRGEREREAAIRAAGAETYGRVGQPSAFRTAGGEMGPAQPTPEQNALAEDELYRNMGGRLSPEAEQAMGLKSPTPGDASKMFPKQELYTEDQAQQDYLRRLKGIDIGKAQQYEKGALELGALKRGERYAQKQEVALGFNQNILSDLTKNGGDAAAVIEKHFIPLYNENKLPGLADGGTAKLVPSAVGSGKSILITDKDGKESTMPADMATLQKLTGYAQKLMMESSTPENYWKAREEVIKKQQADAGTISAQAAATNAATSASELQQKIASGLFGAEARLKGAQATSALASAKQATAHAGVYENMVKLANENREAAEAIKPFLKDYADLSAEDQMGSKGQSILVQAAAAAAKKTGDVTGIINALKKADKSQVPEIDPKLKEAAYKEYSEAGTDPKALAAVKAKYPGVFGQSALDKALAGNKPADAAPAVEGRPFYNKSNEELMRMTKRAIGTSTSEAREAQAELDARKGESRMKAF